jgi:hypothetical protein
MTPAAAAQFLVTTFSSGFGHEFEYAYFIGISQPQLEPTGVPGG